VRGSHSSGASWLRSARRHSTLTVNAPASATASAEKSGRCSPAADTAQHARLATGSGVIGYRKSSLRSRPTWAGSFVRCPRGMEVATNTQALRRSLATSAAPAVPSDARAGDLAQAPAVDPVGGVHIRFRAIRTTRSRGQSPARPEVVAMRGLENSTVDLILTAPPTPPARCAPRLPTSIGRASKPSPLGNNVQRRSRTG